MKNVLFFILMIVSHSYPYLKKKKKNRGYVLISLEIPAYQFVHIAHKNSSLSRLFYAKNFSHILSLEFEFVSNYAHMWKVIHVGLQCFSNSYLPFRQLFLGEKVVIHHALVHPGGCLNHF